MTRRLGAPFARAPPVLNALRQVALLYRLYPAVCIRAWPRSRHGLELSRAEVALCCFVVHDLFVIIIGTHFVDGPGKKRTDLLGGTVVSMQTLPGRR